MKVTASDTTAVRAIPSVLVLATLHASVTPDSSRAPRTSHSSRCPVIHLNVGPHDGSSLPWRAYVYCTANFSMGGLAVTKQARVTQYPAWPTSLQPARVGGLVVATATWSSSKDASIAAPALGLHRLLGHELGLGEQRLLRLRGLVAGRWRCRGRSIGELDARPDPKWKLYFVKGNEFWLSKSKSPPVFIYSVVSRRSKISSRISTIGSYIHYTPSLRIKNYSTITQFIRSHSLVISKGISHDINDNILTGTSTPDGPRASASLPGRRKL